MNVSQPLGRCHRSTPMAATQICSASGRACRLRRRQLSQRPARGRPRARLFRWSVCATGEKIFQPLRLPTARRADNHKRIVACRDVHSFVVLASEITGRDTVAGLGHGVVQIIKRRGGGHERTLGLPIRQRQIRRPPCRQSNFFKSSNPTGQTGRREEPGPTASFYALFYLLSVPVATRSRTARQQNSGRTPYLYLRIRIHDIEPPD